MIERDDATAGLDELPAPGERALPELDFATFVLSIVGSALVHLGDAPEPETGKPAAPNLFLARQNIELLGLLQDKTRGNLTGEEERVVNQGLYDLRIRYLEVAKVK